MFPLILIQLENGPNEFYFTKLKWQYLTKCCHWGNLINLAAIEKTKRKNITELQESEGNKKIKLKKNLLY